MILRVLLLLSLAVLSSAAQAQPREIAVYATGGQTGKSWHGQARVQALNVELGRAVSPRLDVGFVFAPFNFHQPRSWFGDQYGDGEEDVRALSVSLLVRRHWNRDSRAMAFHAEASSGPMWAEKAVPASTSRFNFISQFGAGVTLLPQSRLPLIAGYRFMHISNGGYSPRNPGLNVSSVVLGVQLRR